MNAILLLKKVGFTRSSIAERLAVTDKVVGMWERGDRFPSKDNFAGLVSLGNEHGLNLLAGDFVTNEGEGV